jgi:peptidoglycan hydrolase CwlO-like protein
MRNHTIPFIAATLISLVVGMGMFVIGTNAALNKNTAPVLNAPASSNAANAVSNDQAQIEQLRSLVIQYQQREQQYQQREKQYQDQINAAQQKLDQATSTIQQYQQVLVYLQRLGIIQVDQSGRILLPEN